MLVHPASSIASGSILTGPIIGRFSFLSLSSSCSSTFPPVLRVPTCFYGVYMLLYFLLPFRGCIPRHGFPLPALFLFLLLLLLLFSSLSYSSSFLCYFIYNFLSLLLLLLLSSTSTSVSSSSLLWWLCEVHQPSPSLHCYYYSYLFIDLRYHTRFSRGYIRYIAGLK